MWKGTEAPEISHPRVAGSGDAGGQSSDEAACSSRPWSGKSVQVITRLSLSRTPLRLLPSFWLLNIQYLDHFPNPNKENEDVKSRSDHTGPASRLIGIPLLASRQHDRATGHGTSSLSYIRYLGTCTFPFFRFLILLKPARRGSSSLDSKSPFRGQVCHLLVERDVRERLL